MLGGINVLKMLCCGLGKQAPDEDSTKWRNPIGALFLVPFFSFHYGMFCFVHGVFVFALLSGDGPFGGNGGPGFDPFDMQGSVLAAISENQLWLAILALAASHLYSFFHNYLGKGEYQATTFSQLMTKPYGRIVVLHLALLFGAFLILALGSPILLLLILVVGKTGLDLKLHLREHQQQADTLVTSND